MEVPLFHPETVRVTRCFAALTAIYMLLSRVDGDIVWLWAVHAAAQTSCSLGSVPVAMVTSNADSGVTSKLY